jgi:hypothetical protein
MVMIYGLFRFMSVLMFLNINRLFVVIRELQKPIIFFRFIQIVGAF